MEDPSFQDISLKYGIIKNSAHLPMITAHIGSDIKLLHSYRNRELYNHITNGIFGEVLDTERKSETMKKNKYSIEHMDFPKSTIYMDQKIINDVDISKILKLKYGGLSIESYASDTFTVDRTTHLVNQVDVDEYTKIAMYIDSNNDDDILRMTNAFLLEYGFKYYMDIEFLDNLILAEYDKSGDLTLCIHFKDMHLIKCSFITNMYIQSDNYDKSYRRADPGDHSLQFLVKNENIVFLYTK